MDRSVSLEMAEELLDVGIREAEEADVRIVMSVVNPDGNIVALRRMDEGSLASVSISMNKAYTAATLQEPSQDLADLERMGEDGFGPHFDSDRFLPWGGGFPLQYNGRTVGAIGVSGAPTEVDIDIAHQVLERFDELADA